MALASGAAVAYAVKKVKDDEYAEEKVPLMAVSAAFVFAAQMINFAIPATGSSGHIGGGILLAGLLGGPAAFLSITAVLIIQCLFFADGGLLALGANVFNMGVIPALLIYPLIFKPLLKKISAPKISLAAILSVIIALQLGAFGVVIETYCSGISQLPFSAFLLLMQPIHLAIGAMEGIITAAVLLFVYKTRPEIIYKALGRNSHALSPAELSAEALTHAHPAASKAFLSQKAIILTIGISALCIAGFISLLASIKPDGLEWAIEGVAGKAEIAAQGGIYDTFRNFQEKLAIMPDYTLKGSGSGWSFPGLVGAVVTFAFAGIIAYIISVVKKRKKQQG
jgi:cobalt/nickel transport system permease protein